MPPPSERPGPDDDEGRARGERPAVTLRPVIALVLSLVGMSFVLSAVLTWVVRGASRRAGAIDSPGVAGQVKAARRAIPNTGGVGIFLGVALAMGAGLVAAWWGEGWVKSIVSAAAEHLAGARRQTPLALVVLGSLSVLHVLGLVDDRRPLGPFLKLGVMLGLAGVVVGMSDTRLLTMLDARVGGAWLSILVTVLWFAVVTNAMNFMDNMDGLAGGVAAIAGACFLVAALDRGQWFVASCLAMLVGSCAGFLVFNFPWRSQERGGGATIFMGDGGSLVVGFLLAFLTVRTTYTTSPAPGADGEWAWYAVLMPLCVLAVPIYDFASVVLIRVGQGKSPFVGDLQHLSHRIARLGLSRRAAVVVIHLMTLATGASGIALGALTGWRAALAGVQVMAILLALAVFEFARARAGRGAGSP